MQPPVEDVDHVLGPLAGWETVLLVETNQPIVGISFADDEECRPFFADGESTFYLRVRVVCWEVRLHARA